ncbi:MAG: phosphoribosylanthranilate isomerase [Blautia sp.]
MIKVKICGIKTKGEAEILNRWQPDFAGFVFAEGKRQISLEKAIELKAILSPQIKTVGVFVNAPLEQAVRAAERGAIDFIQLHGQEEGSYMEALRNYTDKPLIKALRVRTREDILQGEKLPCDYLLLDTYVKGSWGGSGQAFDWSLIPPIEKPYFLAGGLTGENVELAMSLAAPFALDVSSGVEGPDGKDEEKIREFIDKVRKNHE